MSAAGQSQRERLAGGGVAGPYPVGEYARALRTRLREFTRVGLVGEIVNIRASRARMYFELRDGDGAIPCSCWRQDWERCVQRAGDVVDGLQVVVAGGCDYYPGTSTSSPGFSFAVADLRVAGVGDLLARIDRLRKLLASEGLLERQGLLHRPALPRSIGVITGETGKARDDVLAGLGRRGWQGRLVWGFAPVQDRHAAPAIVTALGDLAAIGEVDVIVVARGGGSLADLLCFCDETLCRTVALLGVPVIASVGHHTDRTLLDDVAAVSCSTPTHAAEVAVAIDCTQARASLGAASSQLREGARRAILWRAQGLTALSRAPSEHLTRQRGRLHQQLREIRAGARRRMEDERRRTLRDAAALQGRIDASVADCARRRPRELHQLSLALDAHDPQRALNRGYALVQTTAGLPLATAARARDERDVRLRFADGLLDATISTG